MAAQARPYPRGNPHPYPRKSPDGSRHLPGAAPTGMLGDGPQGPWISFRNGHGLSGPDPSERQGLRMRYEIVAAAYRDLEQASARLAMIDRLAGLFAETPTALLPTVALLCQGRIAPDFAGVEIGLAERLAARAVAHAPGVPPQQAPPAPRGTRDPGPAAEPPPKARAGAPTASPPGEGGFHTVPRNAPPAR